TIPGPPRSPGSSCRSAPTAAWAFIRPSRSTASRAVAIPARSSAAITSDRWTRPFSTLATWMGAMGQTCSSSPCRPSSASTRTPAQARVLVVGDGDLYWPIRVHSRYLLLDHAVRLPGHLDSDAVDELIQAADIIAVPSRDSTPWWPILAGWAAGRPVLATHDA